LTKAVAHGRKKVSMRVFYLDDDIEEVLLFSEAIQELDQRILCEGVTDSMEGLRQLQHNPPPDLIFLDFNMPALSGEDCLLLIRQFDHLKNVPVVIYSNGANDKMKQRLIKKGAAMVIKKHDTIGELKTFFKTTFLIPTATN
jgi:CheY-like chemotaxis protein